MQSIQLKTKVNADGFLSVEMPPEFKNLAVEIMLVFQPLSSLDLSPVYPNGRFYGSCAHDEVTIDNDGMNPDLDDDLDLIDGVA
jgi:hypothetical protein